MVRTSKQKEVVLQALKDNVIHPTADELYKIISRTNSSIGSATVYRNLNTLAEERTIKKIDGLETPAHFDHNTHKHYHFICDKCKKIYDVSEDVAPNVDINASKETGFKITGHDITFHGICSECIKKETEND